MCLIKIELSKITYSFQILFRLGLKLLLVCYFCHFPHLTKEIERCAQSKLNCLELPMAFKPSLNWNKNYFLCAFFAIFPMEHLICNHFSRKVVLEKWFCKLGFFFLLNHFSPTWKKVDLWYKTIFFLVNHFSQTRFLEPDFSNHFSRTTFLHFSRKVVVAD